MLLTIVIILVLVAMIFFIMQNCSMALTIPPLPGPFSILGLILILVSVIRQKQADGHNIRGGIGAYLTL